MKVNCWLIIFLLIPNIVGAYSWLAYYPGDILRLDIPHGSFTLWNEQRGISVASGIISLHEKASSFYNDKNFLYYPSFALTLPLGSTLTLNLFQGTQGGIKLVGEEFVDFQYEIEVPFFDTLNPKIKAGEFSMKEGDILYSLTPILWIKPTSWLSVYAGYSFLKRLRGLWGGTSWIEYYYYSGERMGVFPHYLPPPKRIFLGAIKVKIFLLEYHSILYKNKLNYPTLVSLGVRHEPICATIISTNGSNLPTSWHFKFGVDHLINPDYKLKYGGSISPWYRENKWDKVSLSFGVEYKFFELAVSLGSRSYTKVPPPEYWLRSAYEYEKYEEQIDEFTIILISGINYKF